MNILSVAYPFAPVGPDAVGGAEQILSTLDRALVEAGHRSIVVACHGSTTSGELIAHCLPDGEISEDRRAAVQRVVATHVAEATRRCAIDLVHLHGIDFASYFPPVGWPCLATLHLPPSWYPPEALAPSRPDSWIHAVSATQHHACPGSPALLPPIANGVPVEAFAGARHACRGYALTLGRICPEKGQHVALVAARAAGVSLLIGGAVFPYEAHQAYFAREVAPRLDRRRRFLGPVGFARKRRLLAAARCLLVPSLAEETSSLVTMEALAAGTPVIAHAVGALPELIEHGRTGFLVHDAAAMAEAIGRVGQLDREECRHVARTRFGEQRMIAAYLDRYAALIAAAATA